MFKFSVRGIVQGVGFRPFIYNEAKKFNLKGYVQNTGNGVTIVCDNKDIMLKILKNPPSLSKIEDIRISTSNNKYFTDFSILKSELSQNYSPIPADLNICDDCLKELETKGDQREGYFFISCTNCGPRYSIVKSTPYDRENTSLKEFKLCSNCRDEFNDPTNRRYHAQTVACSNCGPKLTLYKNKKSIECKDPIKEVAALLKQGEVLAIKGIGGFHLVCITKDKVVRKLKRITKRFHKPFALLGKEISMIQSYVYISEKEKEFLLSKQRPIILLEKKGLRNLLEISELSSFGFMLPYTPTHYLLFNYLDEPLVFTSSNLPSYPITTQREEQFVEYVLDYNREISNVVDDSLVKIIENHPLIIRRSRGYAPNEIKIPKKFQTTKEELLAVGGELKNTFCIKKVNKLILSPHIGNTFNLENFKTFEETVHKFLEFTSTKPQQVLADSNESFNTSFFAREYSQKNNLNVTSIQHHLAHGFSVALEYNLDNFIAIVCDGTGLGVDEKVWGGEVFHNDKRIGHLEYQPLVGGDNANKEPLRMLVGILSKFLSKEETNNILINHNKLEVSTYYKQAKENFNCIDSSSCGRVLDCVAILLNLCDKNYYEGRGAMILESHSSKKVKLFFEPVIEENILMTTPLFKFIIENKATISKDELARFSQIYLAKGLHMIAKNYGKKLPIVFSGGCAYNSIMTSFMLKNKVFLNKEIPPGDGGLSAGQIAYYLWKNKN